MHRVVVTGIGLVSPVGCEIADFWSSMVDGRSGIGPMIFVPNEPVNTTIAAEVKNFDPAEHFDPKQANMMDRFAQFAVVAARKALKDSGLELTEELSRGAATVVGTGVGGQITLDNAYFKIYRENGTRVHPLTVPRLMVNAGASQISMDLGLKGPTWTVATACASGTDAVGQAFHLVRFGQAPMAMAGGAEACLASGTIKGWEALRVLAPDTCRPFSRTRMGTVLGEGAAMFVLERREDAVARGARIYAEILGFGMSADARDVTAADPDGGARAMRAALADAKRNPEDIDYVNAHGTGTNLNDKTEVSALGLVFGPELRRIPVSSSKGVLGHSLGGAGALEAAASVLAIHHETIPPTANFQEPDPECAIDCVPNTARQAQIRTVMSNSFAFGGLNGVLVLGRA